MSALLIVTTSQTDIQLVIDGTRWEFDKGHCAALHAELARRDDWEFVDSKLPKSGKKGKDTLPEEAFHLCTPKLDAVLDHCEELPIHIGNALVLDTRTDKSGEPVHAGPVLARRLQEKLSVTPSVVTYLSGSDDLENRESPRDAVLRRDVVARIDDAVRTAIQAAAPTSIVVFASGMAKVSSLVEEVVRLHAGDTRVDLLDVPDASKTSGNGIDHAVQRKAVPSPHASFEARRHALELIRGGHLLGAWGAVRHLHKDPGENSWTRMIEWLYLWASSLPMPDDCDIDILKHPRSAVRAALRVELALRAEDVPGAVHGTVAFFEAALWDHLLELLSPHPDNRRLFSASVSPPENLVRDDALSSRQNRKRPFQKKDVSGNLWFRVHEDARCSISLADGYLRKPHLTALAKAVCQQIRDLRNDVAHTVPTPERMAAAQNEMQKKKLWSSDIRFICQPLVTNALLELGVTDPASLFTRFIDIVEKRLLAHRCSVRAVLAP